MAKTIFGLFDTSAMAETVAVTLVDNGFPPRNVSIIMSDHADVDRVPKLMEGGLSQSDAIQIADALDNDQTLMAVNVEDEQAPKVRELLRTMGAQKVSESGQIWSDLRNLSVVADSDTTSGSQFSESFADAALPVMEDELEVNRWDLERGLHAEQEPAEQAGQAQDFSERSPVVSQSVSSDYKGAFQEGEWEITTVAEQAFITKQARVVEEVVISKAVEVRTETVRETVHHTDVQVERLDTTYGTNSVSTDFEQNRVEQG